MNDYPPFSGPEPTCPKCGMVGAKTEHMTMLRWLGSMAYYPTSMFGSPSPEQRREEDDARAQMKAHEWLQRTCMRCDWGWREAITG